MRARTNVIMFAGPTLAESRRARSLARARGVGIRPPIRRRDLPQLLAKTRKANPGVICIVDGVFHDTLAVGHAEIRETLARGWRVWGLSSMGAIRAREMQTLGMRGFGRVFDLFNDSADFQDDEVALLHEAARPFRPPSEALVHQRAALRHLVGSGLVGQFAALAVIDALKRRWYGERTMSSCPRFVASSEISSAGDGRRSTSRSCSKLQRGKRLPWGWP
jgi:hypothetical protein